MLQIGKRSGPSPAYRAMCCLCLVVLGLCGCQTSHYYVQAIGGEYQILHHRQPIAELMASPNTDAKLKAQFELVTRLRAFADTELKLPIDKHYLTYVDLHRRFAVWNVHAAPKFSLEPKKWWYPFVGSLKYRGFFSEDDARRYGGQLDREGYDVYLEGVEAYSTLGFFADPLLNTFIHNPEPDLAEIIFHELAHQRLFLSGDTDFNEAFATAVAEEGVRRWYLDHQDKTANEQYLVQLGRNQQFVALVMHGRHQLEELYDRSGSTHSGTSATVDEREEKERITAQLREDYRKLKASWGGYSGYDQWFGQSLNNAQLNTIAVYYELVPAFAALLRGEEGNLERFYNTVSEMKKVSKDQRHRRLLDLAGNAPRRSGP